MLSQSNGACLSRDAGSISLTGGLGEAPASALSLLQVPLWRCSGLPMSQSTKTLQKSLVPSISSATSL